MLPVLYPWLFFFSKVLLAQVQVALGRGAHPSCSRHGESCQESACEGSATCKPALLTILGMTLHLLTCHTRRSSYLMASINTAIDETSAV